MGVVVGGENMNFDSTQLGAFQLLRGDALHEGRHWYVSCCDGGVIDTTAHNTE